MSDSKREYIKTFIEDKYPDAGIVKIERNDKTCETDITLDDLNENVISGLNTNWLYTSWGVAVIALPDVARDIADKAAQTGYHIDDTNFRETPQSNYFLPEPEKGNTKLSVKADEEEKEVI